MRRPTVGSKKTPEPAEEIEPGSRILWRVGVDLVDLGKGAGARRWMAVFIDQEEGGSDYTWVFFAKSKTDFKKKQLLPFKAEIALLNRKIRGFQSDAEKVYFNPTTRAKELKGMRVTTSAPYFKEQNGRVEKSIDTLKNTARVLRIKAATDTGKPFPSKCTPDSYIFACHLRNSGPTRSDLKSSPHERLHGTKPDFRGGMIFFDPGWA